ncbi:MULTISPECIES: MFS transporter [Pseudomonas]|uniref:MFS transporter n=1 Tax=Pseudomonas TaxID=286 RepID=UPI000863723F|nr:MULTISPECIES: MFS transporter [Pseudomonas]MDG9889972.1 MFS transporter [Pseudomonas juntendi]QOH70635.1 MFS transporter [Pseudomonas putida]RFQ03442.1 MFS transporter [Pseudomonas putida]
MTNQTYQSLHSPKNISRAFWVCWVALFAAGFAMMLKLSFAGTLKAVFFDTTSPLTSAALVGGILGITYLGFTICNTVLPPFIDALKIKRVLFAGLIIFNAGFIIMISAEPGSASAYNTLWWGSLLHGIGWGCIESVVNPVVPSLYPEDKAGKLNRLHTSWPLGWMLAGLLAVSLESASFDWRYMFALSLLPASIAMVMLFFVEFPPTERVSNGVSFKGMCKELFVKPGIFILVFIMFLALACETVPQNWLDIVVGQISGIKGTWLLIYVAIAYLFARGLAEVAVKYVHAVTILIFACVASFVSVLGLAYATNPYVTMAATALLGVGAALMWPNMLAIASERYPNTGSLGIGLMCASGMASGYVVVPWMGELYDGFKVAAAGGSEAFKALAADSPAWLEANAYAATRSFELFSILPLALIVYFLIDYVVKVRKSRGAGFNIKASYAK